MMKINNSISDQNVEESDDDETSSVGSTNTETKGGRRTRNRTRLSKQLKVQYKFSSSYKEDHNQHLYGVSFNHLIKEPIVFAAVGSNRVSVYECLDNGKLNFLQCYADPDLQEEFYTCAWSYTDDDYKPILAVAGLRGIIRILNISVFNCTKVYIGHGHSINDLKFHPSNNNILLSVSKDHTLRLWNVKTDACIAIFGGVEGHRDEVVSADFDFSGNRIISGGIDHSLKLWHIKPEIQTAIKNSFGYDSRSSKTFDTIREHYPDFSTRDIHRNYVDCVRWFGDFIVSKSCENSVVFWKPELNEDGDTKISYNNASILHQLKVKDCDVWFIRFSMDCSQKVLAMGNRLGKLFVWDLDVQDPTEIRSIVLNHSDCNKPVRQTSFSRDGSILLAVCDDGTIWRWDRVTS